MAPSTAGFEVDSTRLTDSAENGSTWDVTVPQVSGGVRTTRRTFNDALAAAADRVTSAARDDDATVTITDGELAPDERSRTVVARSTLSGVLITLSSTAGAAYPSHGVETVVLDPGGDRVLALDDLFVDPAAARHRLAALATAADPSGRLAQVPAVAEDLNAWIALDAGLHLYVPVVHALGDHVPVTIPWPELAALLNPAGRVLFSSL
ncbi:MAG: hypothetical protein QM809_04070 [Gordonia sp. (in: high G+C Gram-positive bacteria)]|uniref:hypothetical protein n=1 Tax=Gordonia sp. (in: high G+C Gram-positive bacteria) TaxID=84139 RepID=UPI0039E321E2